MLIILLFFCGLSQAQNYNIGASGECPEQYVRYGNYCYGLIDLVVPAYLDAERHCNGINNGHLMSIETEEEYNFVMSYSPWKRSYYPNYPECPWIGLHIALGAWQYIDGKKGIIRWKSGEPNNYNSNQFCGILCLEMASNPSTPCMYDHSCTGQKRFFCKSPILAPVKTTPPPQTCGANAESRKGKCVCKKGYIDILETDISQFEKRRYKKGEKCISLNPCEGHSASMSIMFIIDSSESIGEKNWEKLIDFLDEGADKLPSEADIGFIKFSNAVTSSEWLKGGEWTQRKYEKAVPHEYDAGATNTPAALKKAEEMLEKRSSAEEKVAVLITDGTPFVDGVEEKTIKKETDRAVEKLKKSGVRLVVMGYGTGLSKGMEQIRDWVDEPNKDFFEYGKAASFLKQTHMCYLLSKVCNRS